MLTKKIRDKLYICSGQNYTLKQKKSALLYLHTKERLPKCLLHVKKAAGILPLAGKYELDYWGASYKEATEWLVDNKNLTHADIIYSCNVDWSVDYYSQKEFFMTFGSDKTANYTICDSENELGRGYKGEIIYQVKRQGVVLNTVRKH